ncbi:MAG TPA: cupin domain-containing protein [Chitinophagaceae bacterium]
MPYINPDGLTAKDIAPGFNARYIHTDNLSVGYISIKKGSVLPKHSHVHEQITHVLEGKLEMTVDGEVKVVEPGVVAVIPSNVEHSAVALEDCWVLDVFWPVREDYRF